MFVRETPRRVKIPNLPREERGFGKDFYYAGGRRIPVVVLESARVAHRSHERFARVEPGWTEIPLGHRDYTLRVRSEAVSERRHGAYHIEAIVPDLLRLDATLPASDDRAIALLSERDEVPAVVDEGGALLLPTGEVVAAFSATLPPSEIETILRAEGAVSWRPIRGLDGTFVVEPACRADAFTLAAKLVERHGATFAAPNFIEECPPRLSPVPPNALFDEQWHIGRAMIADAWSITRGSEDIVVCIVDSGIDTEHEAFTGAWKLVPGYDFQDDDPFPDPATSSHGTSCAGVAVASWGRGKVVGVAPYCRLMPVRRGSCSDHVRMAEAFIWVTDQGADVISCSFGYDNRPWVLPDVVRAALERAATRGRAGRGCVIVWAAGNGNEPVSSDEWASCPHVIAVAACTDADVRASYSDYGPEVAICAPSNGGRKGITTTVNRGYTTQFGGTSAAAPIVAGVAALVLSVAPGLSAREVRELLCRTADRIDPSNGHYDGAGHSAWYGFGRVNAARALRALSVLDELARGTDLWARCSDIRRFADEILALRATGRAVLDIVEAQRFRLLELSRRSEAFRDDVRRVLFAIADAYMAITSNRPLLLENATWAALVAVAQALLAPTEARSTDDGERATNDVCANGPSGPSDYVKNADRTKENDMSTTNATIDEILAKLGELLRVSQGSASGGTTTGNATTGGGSNGAATTAGSSTGGSTTGGTTAGGANAPLSLENPADMVRLREWLGTEMMYMQMIPPVTPQMLEHLDDLVESMPARLKSIGARPYLMSQVAAQLKGRDPERSTGDPEFERILREIVPFPETSTSAGSAGDDERWAQLVTAALGLFGAGCTVGAQTAKLFK